MNFSLEIKPGEILLIDLKNSTFDLRLARAITNIEKLAITEIVICKESIRFDRT